MNHKLAAFSAFSYSLYPHEVDYLLAVQKFTKPENLRILNLVHYNSKNPLNPLPYDLKIDKRTYSHLKNWISQTLEKIDVDIFYDWLLKTEQQVMSDTITPEREKEMMKEADNTKPSRYYFIRFYQVMQHYRDYLMVRNRIRYYSKVTEYLENYHSNYVKAVTLNNDMNIAAERIVKQIAANDSEFIKWEKLFQMIYYDISLDGYTRYRAAVRLTILYYTNREFEKLREIYDHLDFQFRSDVFYSKRILANYYHNRAMMHSKLNEFEIAEKYGYLSVRQHNSDYLFYLVSLCDILLRNGKNTEPLKLMTESIPELKNTNSFHSKIGFVSFYIKTLCANQQVEKAVNYGMSFFDAYRKEIFEYRWHLFFSSFFYAMLKAEKYQKIISLSQRYKLVLKEKQYLQKAAYMPVILFYTTLADYMDGNITRNKLIDTIIKTSQPLIDSKYKAQKVRLLLKDIALIIPDEWKEININLRWQ